VLRVLAILIGASLTATGSASAENPLPKLSAAEPGGRYCFQRIYDAAHLRRHSGQRTTSALISLQHGADTQGVWLRARLNQNGRSTAADIFAACEWSETANRDTSGNLLLPTFPKEAGFVCIALADPSSAEELGTVMFDLGPDGRRLTAYFDDAVGLWSASNPKPGEPMLKLGREDRVFRLERTGAAACHALEQDLKDE
jgi:hypothetical protein